MLKVLFTLLFLFQSGRISDWKIQAWGGQPPKPKAAFGGKYEPFYFDIPAGDSNGSRGIGYITVGFTEDITGKSELVFTFQTQSTGAPTYNVNLQADNQASNCMPPPIGGGYGAIVVPILIRNGAYGNLTYPDPGQYYRWFARDYMAAILPNGNTQVIVPLDPAVWMAVYGVFGDGHAADGTVHPDAPAEWAATLANLTEVGFTFGGGCYLSHGINVQTGTGSTRFTLVNYLFQ